MALPAASAASQSSRCELANLWGVQGGGQDLGSRSRPVLSVGSHLAWFEAELEMCPRIDYDGDIRLQQR